jgi:hypothetical protein
MEPLAIPITAPLNPVVISVICIEDMQPTGLHGEMSVLTIYHEN